MFGGVRKVYVIIKKEMFELIKRHKIVSSVIVVNIIVILIVILLIVIQNAKTAMIDVCVAPSGATIKLNGKRYDNFQSYNMLPGDYHVEIFMDGMQTKEYDLFLGDGEFVRVWNYLLDNNGGFDYYIVNSDEEATLEKVANDEKSREFVGWYDKVYGVLERLPITEERYLDNYSRHVYYSVERNDGECSKAACLTIIDYTGGNEQYALDNLKNQGFELDNYDIKYTYEPMYGSGG